MLTIIMIVGSCSRTPNNILGKKDMTSLLADLYKGEAYAEKNRNMFYNDSTRKALKQSILEKYGLDQEQFDENLDWYGHHIDDYVEINKKVIEKLQKENTNLVKEAKRLNEALPSEMGDSVNIWVKSPQRMMNASLGDTIISFDVIADENFRRGDSFDFRYKLLDNGIQMQAFMGIEYDNGMVSYTTANLRQSGWNNISVQSDSTMNVKRVFGMVSFTPKSPTTFVDSISLIRLCVEKSQYFRLYSLRTFSAGVIKEEYLPEK